MQFFFAKYKKYLYIYRQVLEIHSFFNIIIAIIFVINSQTTIYLSPTYDWYRYETIPD